ncbi:cytochrome c oxidase subunit 3 [Akkermansiaceae bacterium]|nr:cytochrome c oxidase subunit 3 [Akkermansiaceae bacterium]
MSTPTTKRYPGINLVDGHESEHDKTETSLFGFWVFMMSDLILFGLMFAVYITMIGATASGPGPKELFDFTSLGIQTILLLLSSLTIGLAAIAMKHKEFQKQLIPWLIATLVLGLLFFVFEIKDFVAMAKQGGVPSRSGYLSAFYMIVVLHGFHVLMGSLWLAVILAQLKVHGLVPIVRSRIMRLALLWHFLDVIWIGIFSIVYFGGWLYG